MKTLKYDKRIAAAIIITIAFGFFNLTSCKKQDDFLNVKRLNSDVTPSTLQDFQAILDNVNAMNYIYPVIGLAGTDNIIMSDATLKTASYLERNSYLWGKDIFEGQASSDWTDPYIMIEYSNIVLDGLQKISVNSGNQVQYNQIKGSALFYRSFAFYYLAQLFCQPYNTLTANTDPGIPLRLTSDINIPSTRPTVQQTYNQILSDVQLAVTLLPTTPVYVTRPAAASANALLAKVYLTMEDYVNAGKYSNSALTINNTLLDYNSNLILSSKYHFPTFTVGNPEITFWGYTLTYSTLKAYGTANVDTLLYNSYAANDLRRTLFYTKVSSGVQFIGSYVGSAQNFAGIANDEVYLIRAECSARAGNTSEAMTDLNTLLVKRWKKGTFVPFTATSSTDALTQILLERRKELPLTGLIRWEDLRRLNKDPRFAKTISHQYNGTIYTLPPNDKRYVYQIPDLEIQQFGIQQNDR